MTDRATGIKTLNADQYVATFQAAEQAEGKNRLVQVIALTGGKLDINYHRSVTVDDSLDVTTVSGNIEVGDNHFLGCYVKHAADAGSCLVTPLLCNVEGSVIGCLEPKVSKVMLPVTSGSYYLSPCLSWDVVATGAWRVYPHVSYLSNGNSIEIDSYVF